MLLMPLEPAYAAGVGNITELNCRWRRPILPKLIIVCIGLESQNDIIGKTYRRNLSSQISSLESSHVSSLECPQKKFEMLDEANNADLDQRNQH